MRPLAVYFFAPVRGLGGKIRAHCQLGARGRDRFDEWGMLGIQTIVQLGDVAKARGNMGKLVYGGGVVPCRADHENKHDDHQCDCGRVRFYHRDHYTKVSELSKILQDDKVAGNLETECRQHSLGGGNAGNIGAINKRDHCFFCGGDLCGEGGMTRFNYYVVNIGR